MIPEPNWTAELEALLERLIDGEFDAADRTRLNDLLSQGEVQRRYYRGYMRLHYGLEWRQGTAGAPAVEQSSGFMVQGSGQSVDAIDAAAHSPFHFESPFPVALPPSNLRHLLSATYIGGPVFSYMVATVVLGMLLLGAWAYTITHDHHGNYVQKNSRGPTAPGRSTLQPPELAFVGRVTGMKDCRWGDPKSETHIGASVPPDRKYSLASGLMEITYRSGAKVILEGPCDYTVESDASGYLAVGKLTALVEKRGRVGDGETGRKPRSPLLPSSPSPRLFSVRTPTAVVTDLGTEFGVEVSDDGNTTSHVFRGSVRVEAGVGTGLAGGAQREAMVLRENESLRVEKVGRVRETHQTPGEKTDLVRFTHPTTPPQFVRRMVQPPKLIDILDIVAGGNGAGNRRERGINPVGGFLEPLFVGERRGGIDQYSNISWSRFIDGAFVPNGRAGAVRLDSAGHSFDGFPETTGETYGPIWSRAADSNPSEQGNDPGHWIFLIGKCRQFTPEGRGLLGLCPNVGITFDLQPMRGMWRDARPARLRAVAGLVDARSTYPDADALADLWVFIDGRLMMKRVGLRPQDGPINVDVAIGPDDRFLTLVSTDGGNGDRCDWVVVGDPALEMVSTEDVK